MCCSSRDMISNVALTLSCMGPVGNVYTMEVHTFLRLRCRLSCMFGSSGYSGLSIMSMQMASRLPQDERKPYLCICLLQRIVERIHFAHRFTSALDELRCLIPQYLELFRRTYGEEFMAHKLFGFAPPRHCSPTNRGVPAGHSVQNSDHNRP